MQILNRAILIGIVSYLGACSSEKKEDAYYYDFNPDSGDLYSSSDHSSISERVAVQLDWRHMSFKIWSTSQNLDKSTFPLKGNYEIRGQSIHFDLSIFGEVTGCLENDELIIFTDKEKKYRLKKRDAAQLLNPFELEGD